MPERPLFRLFVTFFARPGGDDMQVNGIYVRMPEQQHNDMGIYYNGRGPFSLGG